jgi:hypothetical protein
MATVQNCAQPSTSAFSVHNTEDKEQLSAQICRVYVYLRISVSNVARQGRFLVDVLFPRQE